MAGARLLYSTESRQLADPCEVSYPDRESARVYVDSPIVGQLSRHATDTPIGVSANGLSANGRQPRRWTQADQTQVDEEKKRKAMKDLVTSWQDRLSLISVITTFFAAIEAQLLGIITPDGPRPYEPSLAQASLTGLACALIVHTFAAILSFLAAFFLIRFRVYEAAHVEHEVEKGCTDAASAASTTSATTNPDLPIVSTNPHLQQVGPFRRDQPPTHLIKNCHSFCMLLAAIGFVLAMVGIMCYVWLRLPLSSSIVATTAISFCIAGSIIVIFFSGPSVHVDET